MLSQALSPFLCLLLSLPTPSPRLSYTSFGMSCSSPVPLVPLIIPPEWLLLPFARCLLTRTLGPFAICELLPQLEIFAGRYFLVEQLSISMKQPLLLPHYDLTFK
jgi:hypothetical protein